MRWSIVLSEADTYLFIGLEHIGQVDYYYDKLTKYTVFMMIYFEEASEWQMDMAVRY